MDKEKSMIELIVTQVQQNTELIKILIEETKSNKQIAYLFENFSTCNQRNLDNLDKKINEEAENRKINIDRIDNLNEYDKIVLKNLESRITILEEESEKYMLNKKYVN